MSHPRCMKLTILLFYWKISPQFKFNCLQNFSKWVLPSPPFPLFYISPFSISPLLSLSPCRVFSISLLSFPASLLHYFILHLSRYSSSFYPHPLFYLPLSTTYCILGHNDFNPHQNDQGRKGPCCFQRLIALKCLKCQKI